MVDPIVVVLLETVHYLAVFAELSLVQTVLVASVLLHVDEILDEMVEVETQLAVVNISLVEHPPIAGLEGGPLIGKDPLIVMDPRIVKSPLIWVDAMAVELMTAEMVEALLMHQ